MIQGTATKLTSTPKGISRFLIDYVDALYLLKCLFSLNKCLDVFSC
jgi:hypothetical protein